MGGSWARLAGEAITIVVLQNARNPASHQEGNAICPPERISLSGVKGCSRGTAQQAHSRDWTVSYFPSGVGAYADVQMST